MATPESVPRRSPRGHKSSYPTHQNLRGRADSLLHGSSALALQGLQSESSSDSDQPLTPQIDAEALAPHSINADDYPPPPPLLSYNPDDSNELSQVAVPAVPPARIALSTQRPSAYASTTQPAGEIQLPSTSPGTTRPLCLNAPNIRPAPMNARTTPSPCSQSPSETDPNRSDERTAGAEKSGEGSRAEAEKQEDLHHLFVHLNRLNVNQQKAVASAFGVVQAGIKKVRAARLFVFISGMMERSKRTATSLLEEKGLEKGKDLKTEFENTLGRWGEKEDKIVIPPIEELEKEGGVRQHQRPREEMEPNIDDESDDDEAPNHSPGDDNVSLEEFARLMIIFRDVPEAAQDLRKSGQDLQRQDLDVHASRHAFWTDRIEELFNDPSLLTFERLDGDLQHIDPGRPVRTRRSGSCLQNLLNKFRKEFTLIYNRWNVSGNLDPSSFVNFCRLPHQTTLTRSGARCLIAFKIFRIGTAHENSLILDFASKEMSGAAGAQLESGITTDNEQAASHKRRRSLTPGGVDEALVTALANFAKEGENAKKKRKEELELEALAVQNARLEMREK